MRLPPSWRSRGEALPSWGGPGGAQSLWGSFKKVYRTQNRGRCWVSPTSPGSGPGTWKRRHQVSAGQEDGVGDETLLCKEVTIL